MSSYKDSQLSKNGMPEGKAFDWLASKAASSGGGSSSGSSTWVQIADGAGGFTASAYLTFDAATGVLNVTGPNGNQLSFDDSNGAFSISVSDTFQITGTNGGSLNSENPINIGGASTLMVVDASTNLVKLRGMDFNVSSVGRGIYIKEGTDATMGVASLSGGSVVVSNTKVTANSRIFLTVQSLSGIAVPVGVAVTARTAGTSFTITSASALDSSAIAWLLIEPA